MSHNPNFKDRRRRQHGKCQMDTDRHRHHQMDILHPHRLDNIRPTIQGPRQQCLRISLLDTTLVANKPNNALLPILDLNASSQDQALLRNTQILGISIALCLLLR